MEFTKRTGLSIFEASAKTGNGVEPSFIALTDALIDQAKKNNPKPTETAPSSSKKSSSEKNPYVDENPPFDDGRIKIKKINGRGLGLSSTDRAALYCC